MSYQRKKSEWDLVELPSGFRTSFGYWYTMTTEGIESYVPGLLKLYSVQHLVRIADDWLRSREQLPVLVFMLLVYSPLSVSLSLVLGLTFLSFMENSAICFYLPVGSSRHSMDV